MRRYKLVVFTQAAAGREQDYNDWYQNVHLPDVVAIPGFKSAQRFRLAKTMAGAEQPPFLAIYDVETEDVEGAIAELKRRVGAGAMFISEAMSPNVSAGMFEEFGALVYAPN